MIQVIAATAIAISPSMSRTPNASSFLELPKLTSKLQPTRSESFNLLDGLAATTHRGAVDVLKAVAPKTEAREGKRIVDNGKIVLSAGISADRYVALCCRQVARQARGDRDSRLHGIRLQTDIFSQPTQA